MVLGTHQLAPRDVHDVELGDARVGLWLVQQLVEREVGSMKEELTSMLALEAAKWHITKRVQPADAPLPPEGDDDCEHVNYMLRYGSDGLKPEQIARLGANAGKAAAAGRDS